MKIQKLSLSGIKNVLSRAELKTIMAGSGGGGGGGGGSLAALMVPLFIIVLNLVTTGM